MKLLTLGWTPSGVAVGHKHEWNIHQLHTSIGAPEYHSDLSIDRLCFPEREGCSERSAGHHLEAKEEERRRLGRALHDSTGQLLLYLSLSFAHFRETVQDSGLEGLLDEMSETVTKIASEIRTFSFLEYPAELRSEGLNDVLATFARGFAKRTGLRVVFDNRLTDEIPDSNTALALLRIAQEALVNVHRHAEASVVCLSLLGQGGTVELAISDDGRGFASTGGADHHHGVGIAGMRHRAERLGGRLDIKTLRYGTKVVVTLPLKSSPIAVLKCA
jgi:two-component system NarL family sensor kinase